MTPEEIMKYETDKKVTLRTIEQLMVDMKRYERNYKEGDAEHKVYRRVFKYLSVLREIHKGE